MNEALVATARTVWCGQTDVGSITGAGGYYDPGGNAHDDGCQGCINAQRAARRDA